jgi:hypothetical protein
MMAQKMDRRNTRNPDEKLARNLNCHAKQSIREGQETTKQIKESKTQYFLLRKSNRITSGRLLPEGTTTTMKHSRGIG